MAQEPLTMQLRYLQTVTEIASENNSTTIFPLPMELLRPFMTPPAAANWPVAANAPAALAPPAAVPDLTLPKVEFAKAPKQP
jgi:hypothetical protein